MMNLFTFVINKRVIYWCFFTEYLKKYISLLNYTHKSLSVGKYINVSREHIILHLLPSVNKKEPVLKKKGGQSRFNHKKPFLSANGVRGEYNSFLIIAVIIIKVLSNKWLPGKILSHLLHYFANNPWHENFDWIFFAPPLLDFDDFKSLFLHMLLND